MPYQPTIYDQANLQQQLGGGGLILEAMARNKANEEESRRAGERLQNALVLQRDDSSGRLNNLLTAQRQEQTFKASESDKEQQFKERESVKERALKATEGEADRLSRQKIAEKIYLGSIEKMSAKVVEDRLRDLNRFGVVNSSIKDPNERLIDAEKKLGPLGATLIKGMDSTIETTKAEIEKRTHDTAITQANFAFPTRVDFLPGELDKLKPYLGMGNTVEQAINKSTLKAARKASLLGDYRGLVSEYTVLAPQFDKQIPALSSLLKNVTDKRLKFVNEDEAGRSGYFQMLIDDPANVPRLGPPASLAPAGAGAIDYNAIRQRALTDPASATAAAAVKAATEKPPPPGGGAAAAAPLDPYDQALAYIRGNRQFAPDSTFAPVRTVMGGRSPQTGETIPDPRAALGTIASNLDARAVAMRPGSQTRNELSTRAAQARAFITQIWGDDAPELLPKLADLANQHGVSQEVQTNTFNKALAGDKDAISNIGRDLDFLRQQESPDSIPSLLPGTPSPGLATPSTSPSRGSLLSPAFPTQNFSDPRLAPLNIPGRGALPPEPTPGVYGPRY